MTPLCYGARIILTCSTHFPSTIETIWDLSTPINRSETTIWTAATDSVLNIFRARLLSHRSSWFTVHVSLVAFFRKSK